MRGLLGRFAATRVVAGLLAFGAVVVVPAAVAQGPLGQLLAAFLAVALVVAALALLFVYWIERSNADIDADREDLRRELDRLVDEDQ